MSNKADESAFDHRAFDTKARNHRDTQPSESSTSSDTVSSISPGELASACAHYDLGDIQSVFQYRRGSRKSPKVILSTTTGRYLLKRRAKGRDDPSRVALGQSIQQSLHAIGFPTPRILPTKQHNQSMLSLGHRIYEVFDFVAGDVFDRTPAPCEDAGRVLATMHRELAALNTHIPAPTWSYHDDSRTRNHLKTLMHGASTDAASLAARAPSAHAIAGAMPTQLLSVYRTAAHKANDLLAQCTPASRVTHTPSLLHGDFHPGNMVFRDGRVAAVLDFDTARIGLPITELANGLLQFSLTRVGTNADDWPDGLDANRFARFLTGYVSVAGPFDPRSIPLLMTEAIIAEVAAPIAQTGTFASLDPAPFLRMTSRKAAWIMDHQVGLVGLAQRTMEQTP